MRRHEKRYTPSPESRNQGTNLFVANFKFNAKEADLRELFEQQGKVNTCSLQIDPITK